MEALFAACSQSVGSLVSAALSTEVYAKECTTLARYASKLALLLSEIELIMRLEAYEDLRGSKALFLGLEAIVSALQQAEQLGRQCSRTAPGSVWPLEDAVEFQAAGQELLNATAGEAGAVGRRRGCAPARGAAGRQPRTRWAARGARRVGPRPRAPPSPPCRLTRPPRLCARRSRAAGLQKLRAFLPEDICADLSHFLRQLDRLSFTEDELSETEEREMKHVQHGELPASPRAPPPAPRTTSPACARPPSVGAIAAAESSAAAARLQGVATPESGAEEAEAEAVAAAPPPAPPAQFGPKEAAGQLCAHSSARLPLPSPTLLPRGEGEEAGAGEGAEEAPPPAEQAQGGEPLPQDPFDMGARLASSTLNDLETLKLGGDEGLLEVDPEAQRRLEASADNLSLADQQAAAAARAASRGGTPSRGASPGGGGEGEEGAGEGGEHGGTPAALHLSPSAQATEQILANLAELAATGAS
eukprot:scaffold2.g7340.t1